MDDDCKLNEYACPEAETKCLGLQLINGGYVTPGTICLLLKEGRWNRFADTPRLKHTTTATVILEFGAEVFDNIITISSPTPFSGHGGFSLWATSGLPAMTYVSGVGTQELTFSLEWTLLADETVYLNYSSGDV